MIRHPTSFGKSLAALTISVASSLAILPVQASNSYVMCTFASDDEAIGECTRIIEAGEESGDKLSRVYMRRGAAYAQDGNFDLAIADYDEVIRLSPDSSKAYFERGLLHKWRKDTVAAMSDMNRANELGHYKAVEQIDAISKDDQQIAREVLENFYEAARNPVQSRFFAPKNLAWIVDKYDSETLLRIGLNFLTGQDVEQNIEHAAIILGGLHAVTSSNSNVDSEYKDTPRPAMPDLLVGALAHAAQMTASAYAEKAQGVMNFFDPNMDTNFHLNSGFLEIAIRAGSQEALLMKGYLYRLTRQSEANPNNKLSAAGNEEAHFERASKCNPENTRRKIAPWSQDVCDRASQEMKTSASVRKILLADHLSKQEIERRLAEAEKWDWALIILAGFAASVVEGIHNPNVAPPLSAMEQYERQRKFIEKQEADTWFHVGAVMFVP